MDSHHIGISNAEKMNESASDLYSDVRLLTSKITMTAYLCSCKNYDRIFAGCLTFLTQNLILHLRRFLAMNTQDFPKQTADLILKKFYACLQNPHLRCAQRISSFNQIIACTYKYKELKEIFVICNKFRKKLSANTICMILPPDSKQDAETSVIWPENNVAVGTLRNREQLEICLKHRFYHVPSERIENPAKIKYIAIYQSKNLFGKYAGIRYYGEVTELRRVKRCEIAEIPSKSQNIYYRFEIKEWKTLPKIIKADSSGAIIGITNIFLLLNARTVFELYLKKDEYFLYRSICDAINNDDEGKLIPYKDTVISVQKNAVILYKYDSPYDKFSADMFLRSPEFTLKKIIKKAEE